MRLIDIEDMSLLKTVTDGGLSAKALWRRIKQQPVIDAEPVTRCKDCKYCDGGIDEDGKPFLKCLSGRSYGGTNADDYCAWAERKDIL